MRVNNITIVRVEFEFRSLRYIINYSIRTEFCILASGGSLLSSECIYEHYSNICQAENAVPAKPSVFGRELSKSIPHFQKINRRIPGLNLNIIQVTDIVTDQGHGATSIARCQDLNNASPLVKTPPCDGCFSPLLFFFLPRAVILDLGTPTGGFRPW